MGFSTARVFADLRIARGGGLGGAATARNVTWSIHATFLDFIHTSENHSEGKDGIVLGVGVGGLGLVVPERKSVYGTGNVWGPTPLSAFCAQCPKSSWLEDLQQKDPLEPGYAKRRSVGAGVRHEASVLHSRPPQPFY